MRRRAARAVASVLAGVLLLAQAAVAGYACPSMGGGDRFAPASASTVPPSHDDGSADVSSLDLDAPGLCIEHCKAGQQSDRTASVALPFAVPVLLYAAPTPPVVAPQRPRRVAWLSAMVAASPPHAILHCVRRT